jgi:hypothetical protein
MRWAIFILLVACGSTESRSEAEAPGKTPSGGLFGGSGAGTAGDGVVSLYLGDGGGVEVDGGLDAGPSDGGTVEPDAEATDAAAEDAGTDAGADAGPVNPQCQPCSAMTTCPEGYVCMGNGQIFCTAVPDAGVCPENLVAQIYADIINRCVPVGPDGTQILCPAWLELYGD